jgi:DNA-binding cell septation regulator SpoVG
MLGDVKKTPIPVLPFQLMFFDPPYLMHDSKKMDVMKRPDGSWITMEPWKATEDFKDVRHPI